MEPVRMEEIYETLVRESYDDTKRPAKFTVPEALAFAWETMAGHGLLEARMYEIHAKVRRELGMDA